MEKDLEIEASQHELGEKNERLKEKWKRMKLK